MPGGTKPVGRNPPYQCPFSTFEEAEGVLKMTVRLTLSSRLSDYQWQGPPGSGWRMMSAKRPRAFTAREDHMSNVQPLSSPKRAYVPPPVDGDFYQIKDLLAKEERAILARVRDEPLWHRT